MKIMGYARRWHADGEVPAKVKNENGRMVWPAKFKWLSVTEHKTFNTDVGLVSADDVAELVAAARMSCNLDRVTDGLRAALAKLEGKA